MGSNEFWSIPPRYQVHAEAIRFDRMLDSHECDDGRPEWSLEELRTVQDALVDAGISLRRLADWDRKAQKLDHGYTSFAAMLGDITDDMAKFTYDVLKHSNIDLPNLTHGGYGRNGYYSPQGGWPTTYGGATHLCHFYREKTCLTDDQIKAKVKSAVIEGYKEVGISYHPSDITITIRKCLPNHPKRPDYELQIHFRERRMCKPKLRDIFPIGI